MRLLALALLVGSAGAQGASLCARVRAMTREPAVAAAHWGVSVVRLDGTVVCGVNEGQLFRPASNNKVFTTAAAVALLGAEGRFETRVVGVGELAGGVLKGDLKLVGGGDANFGARDVPYIAPALRPKNASPEPATIADVEELADKVVAGGLKAVEGDVVGDDRYLAWEPYPPDWTLEDALYGYGAPVSGLTVHDNEVVVEVAATGGKGTSKAQVRVVPDVPYYAVENGVVQQAYPGGCDARLGFARAPGSKKLEVFGDIAPEAKEPCRQAIAIEDPAEYAALALKAALERRGVRVSGTARAQHADVRRVGPADFVDPAMHFMLPRMLAQPRPAGGYEMECSAQRTMVPGQGADAVETVLAEHQGPRLIDDVVYTMKVSQNLHAELLLRNLGAALGCAHEQRAGLTAVREYLLHAGVAAGDFQLYDGSGLSGHDLVAPRAFTTFLSYAAGQPWFGAWRASLPEGGVDGTLSSRFPGLKGRVFAKTGTLGESRALSGYVTNAKGEVLVFSVMVDNHLPASADRGVMDRIVMALAE